LLRYKRLWMENVARAPLAALAEPVNPQIIHTLLLVTASQIDHRIAGGDELVLSDLRSKPD
jgi:hypothetical protein